MMTNNNNKCDVSNIMWHNVLVMLLFMRTLHAESATVHPLFQILIIQKQNIILYIDGNLHGVYLSWFVQAHLL